MKAKTKASPGGNGSAGKPGAMGWIFFTFLMLVMAAVLELGKHTLAGWFLAAAAGAGFVLLRLKLFSRAGRAVRFFSWCGLILVSALILWVSRPPVRPYPAVEGPNGGITGVVHVSQGDLTGVLTADGKVEVYAGIPYAQPPVGDLRWRPPVKASPWEGVLRADHFAPMSMQVTHLPIYDSLAQIIAYHDYRISLDDNFIPPVSEDSLYLNIWKPAGEENGLPVLVYIHGGSLQTGQPWYEDYKGEGLAEDGVIVVNMGYRLGIFGFFAEESLLKEDGTSGNYGLLDQIMALEWVRDNISAFGGDPDNVTIAGESAGSACVSALCTSPLARGLFRRAAGESSTVTAPQPAHSFRTLERALSAGRETLARFGALDAEELRSVPAERLAGEMNAHHHITVDGYVLPVTPGEAYAAGIHNEEALFHGFNLEESAPFILFGRANMKNYESNIRALFPEPYASRVLELCPVSDDAGAARAWADIYTVFFFSYGHHCWDRQALSCGIPSYMYHFVKDNGRLGAWHGGEEVYLYGNIPEDSSLYDGEDRTLGSMMKGYFLNFIRTGDPNGEGLPLWTVSGGKDRVMEFGAGAAMAEAPHIALCNILDEMYQTSWH